MRKIIYKCDGCGREYPYELQATDKERGILLKIRSREFCYSCVKKAVEYICPTKLQ